MPVSVANADASPPEYHSAQRASAISQLSRWGKFPISLTKTRRSSASQANTRFRARPAARYARLHWSLFMRIMRMKSKMKQRSVNARPFGISLPFLEEVANHPTLGQAPVVQGTPQIMHAPVVSGTPPLQGTPMFSPGSFNAPGNSPPLPHIQPPQPLFPLSPTRPIRYPIRPTSQPSGNLAGCLPLVAIILATFLIILLTTIGLGLTAFAPGLSLSGNTTVAPGNNLSLHGHNFLPDSSVTLTLDNGTSFSVTSGQIPARLSERRVPAQVSAGLALYAALASTTNMAISTHGDGTFNTTILVLSSWTPGHHTIHASEAISHRSASLSFTIALANATATPTSVPTATAQPTTAPTATATATAVPPPTLSCATPGNLALGPISELSSQIASANVTLCTSGTGTLTWQASWNQNQAPWLHINQASGSVQAPNQILTTLSASAAKLSAGTYTTTVTFLGVQSNTAQSVNVTLTVKAGCVSAAPQSLSFTGVAGVSDPTNSQNVSVTNCGLTSNWSANIDNGSSWLNLSTSQGTLKGGTSKTLAVTASNLNAGLRAGTYNDTITFTIGSDTATISVSLVVQPAPPSISASPTSVNAATAPCANDGNGNSACTVTLTNTSNTTALTWSASASVGGVTVQGSTSIPAGGTEQVTIVVPTSNCGTPVTVTFTAPGNAVNVTWNCTPQTPIT